MLLITIVTIALLSFPKPFGWFDPPNRIVAGWPFIWLPTVHVQLALFGHVVVLRRLWGTAQYRQLAGDGGGSRLFLTIARLLGGVRCYRLRPGRFEAEIELIKRAVGDA